MLGGDALLFATGVGAPIAIAPLDLKLVKLIGGHLVGNSLVRFNVNKYSAKAVHLKKFVDRMYVFKNETLRDHLFD